MTNAQKTNPLPGVGHFTSDDARQRFMNAYDTAMAALPSPQEVHDVPTRFGSVRVYRFGQANAKPLLLLPGRSASTPMWEPNLTGLAAYRTVYTVDLLGEPGKSVQTKAITSAEGQATWLDEVLEALELKEVHLVGVSIGGWTALNQVLYAPERIASISLIDPASVFARFTWKALLASLGATLPFFPQAWRMKMLSWIAGGAETDEDEPTAQLIASGMRDYKNHLPPPTYPTDEQLGSIETPTLAIIAGRSIIHDAEKAMARAQCFSPTIQAECWSDASHAINGEYPDRINQRILKFVNDLG